MEDDHPTHQMPHGNDPSLMGRLWRQQAAENTAVELRWADRLESNTGVEWRFPFQETNTKRSEWQSQTEVLCELLCHEITVEQLLAQTGAAVEHAKGVGPSKQPPSQSPWKTTRSAIEALETRAQSRLSCNCGSVSTQLYVKK